MSLRKRFNAHAVEGYISCKLCKQCRESFAFDAQTELELKRSTKLGHPSSQEVQPIREVGDLPVLNHSRLQWPGLPMYIIGPLSLLSAGPGAADGPGLRWAADRVVAAINSPEEFAQYEAPEPDEGVAENKLDDVTTAHSCGKGATVTLTLATLM